ncbi:hypothetical protein ACYSUW_14910 [Pseudomonas frederiksbergensis]
MAAGIYVVTLGVSSKYYVGLDGRIKFFPAGINPFAKGADLPEPIGLACVECEETKRHLIQVFRVGIGADISSLISIGKSQGVLGLPPKQIIFNESIKSIVTANTRSVLKKEFGCTSISFTKLENANDIDLSTHFLTRSFLEDEEAVDVASFLALVNVAEYKQAIQRTVTDVANPKLINELRDLRVASQIRVPIPHNEWRAPEGVEVFSEASQCVVGQRSGIIDFCTVLNRQTLDDFEHHFSDFYHEMFGGAEDDDDDEDWDDEQGEGLSFEDAMCLLFSVSMLSCFDYGWPEHDLTSEDINDILANEEDVDPDLHSSLLDIISADGIFENTDSHNVTWAVQHLDGRHGDCFVFDLVPPRRVSGRPSYVVVVFESGLFHLNIIESGYYNAGELEMEFYPISEVSQVRVKAATYTAISNLVKFARTPEAMDAAVVLIKTVLKEHEPGIGELIEMFE